MRTYAVLHDVENASATVIFCDPEDTCWYVYTAVIDIPTAEQIVKALNEQEKKNPGSSKIRS